MLQIFFCSICLRENENLNLLFKDEVNHIKEHTKPLFSTHKILSVYNLYPYHVLLELYKILKFRVPYCMYDLFSNRSSNTYNHGLNITIPDTRLDFQRKTFCYQATLCWNQFYKKLVSPFSVILHKNCQIKGDASTVTTINYDFSTPVSTFKLNLNNLLYIKPSTILLNMIGHEQTHFYTNINIPYLPSLPLLLSRYII